MDEHLRLKKHIKRKALEGEFDIKRLFEADDDIRTLTANCMPNNPYRQSWESAFQSYVDGDWATAKTRFESFMQERPDIKTTEVVYNYMGNRNFQAPSDWAGFRALTSM